MRVVVLLLSLVPLAGCATIVEGTGQSITISTTPAGAVCNIDRAGTHLGTVATTPGSVRLDKSKNEITVSCTEEGYQAASISQSPKFVATTFGNLILGGLAGVIVDASTGANFEYPSEVHLDLAPIAPAAGTMPPTATAPAGAIVPSSLPASTPQNRS